MDSQITGNLSEADRTVNSVRGSANELLVAFRSRLESLRGNGEVTKFLLRQGFNKENCFSEAVEFLGGNEASYLAIDGTKFEDYRLDLAIFFAGAFGYGGKLRFSKHEGVTAGAPSSSDDYFSLSSAIPVSEEYSSKVNSEHTEGGEIDPERVSSALMRLCEYFLALSSIKKDPLIKVVFFDRTVSGDIAHISWKMREYIEEGRSILEGWSTPYGSITKADLELGRMLISNRDLAIPAPRSHLLKYAVMNKLIEEESQMTADELVQSLGANKNRTAGIRRQLSDTRVFRGAFSIGKDNRGEEVFSVSEATRYFRERLSEAARQLSNHIFHSSEGHPLKLDPERWITAEDIDYVTLIIISELLQEAWKRNILILGVVKDSAANELVRTVTKVLQTSCLLTLSNEIPRFESDRMLLQANSIVNSSSVNTPWRTIEYDVCFRTISPKDDTKRRGQCSVEGAFKNVIASERTFVKAYFQLWSSSNNPAVRSHVFLYDRPCYPRYEAPGEERNQELELSHKDQVEEKIFPAIHFSKDAKISDLVMGILCSMGSEPIPEAIGHNYPLFLADKRSKIAEKEAKSMCAAAVELEITKSRLDQQSLYERRFRDYRAGLESKRRSAK